MNAPLSERLRDPEAWDYRALLGAAVEGMREKSGRAASFAALSARFGFKSKSFLQHVLRGERHLSPESADRVARALQLDSPSRRIFVSLVRLAHLLDRGHETDALLLRERIRKLRIRRKAEAASLSGPRLKRRLYSDTHGPLIYAALGTPERGATTAEIATRAALPEPSVARTLEHWEAEGLVRRQETGTETRFVAHQPYVFDDSAEGRASVRDFYLASARDALRAAEERFESEDSLFTAWAVSIDSRRKDELAERLKTLLLDFVVQNEDAEGDRVLRLTVAAF